MKKLISIIKEKAPGEVRVILAPKQVILLTEANYEVLVEKGAGEGVGISDDDYKSLGAKIVSTEMAWTASNFIIKYKPPTDDEFKYLDETKSLCAVFHAEGNKELTNKLLESKCTAYSYEFFKTEDNIFPLAVVGSEIAGKVAVIYGSYHLQSHLGGSGILLAPVVGIKPPKVLIIGHGNAGGAAARMAHSMGADVTVLGTNKERLRAFQASMPTAKCFVNSREVLMENLIDADLVIGAILISTFDTPAMLDDSLVKKMKKGSMIVDVTAGYGTGYMPTFDRPTTLKYPVYEKYGVLHCKIDVLPLAYAKTTVNAMSQNIIPYLIDLGNSIYGESAVNSTSQAGKIVEKGQITHPEVERHMLFN